MLVDQNPLLDLTPYDHMSTSLRWPSLKVWSIKQQSEAPCQRKEHQRPIARQMPALCTSPILERLTWVLIVFVRSGQSFPSETTCLMSLICLWISSTIANKVVIICSWASTQVDRHLPMSRTSRGYAYSVAGTKFSPCSQALGWDMRILSDHFDIFWHRIWSDSQGQPCLLLFCCCRAALRMVNIERKKLHPRSCNKNDEDRPGCCYQQDPCQVASLNLWTAACLCMATPPQKYLLTINYNWHIMTLWFFAYNNLL